MAVGAIRKAAVDWDFEDTGVATDDEEQGPLSDQEPEPIEEDVEDSDEDKEGDILTNYGEVREVVRRLIIFSVSHASVGNAKGN